VREVDRRGCGLGYGEGPGEHMGGCVERGVRGWGFGGGGE
jgi:hypothetical protein